MVRYCVIKSTTRINKNDVEYDIISITYTMQFQVLLSQLVIINLNLLDKLNYFNFLHQLATYFY